MRYLPFILILLILISPCTAFAADSGKLSVIPTTPTVSKTISLDEALDTNQTVEVNETEYTTVENVNTVPQDSSYSAGSSMVADGIRGFAVDSGNDVVTGFAGFALGNATNTTGKDGIQLSVFQVAATTIDPTEDPVMLERIKSMQTIYLALVIIIGSLFAMFLMVQTACPNETYKMLETLTGTGGYRTPSDLLSYFCYTIFWLLAGPAFLYLAIKINNMLVINQMLEILDKVAFTSDNIILYLIMICLYLYSTAFFAIRIVSIVLIAHVWIFYGLIVAVKPTRWFGIMMLLYAIGLIVSQCVIIWICCVVVSYATTAAMSAFSLTFVYLGMFLVVAAVESMFAMWPLFMKLFTPEGMRTLVTLARYV